MMMRRLSAALGAAIAAATVVASPALAEKPVLGKPAPNFQVTTFDDKKITLSDLKGQVVVVNIWATWCGPCKVELPLLDTYYKIQKKFGMAVVAVTTEDSVPTAFLKPLAKMLAMPLAHNFRGGGYADVKLVPMNYVIDRAGVIRYMEAGSFTLDRLNEVIVPLLQEAPPEPPEAPPVLRPASAPVG